MRSACPVMWGTRVHTPVKQQWAPKGMVGAPSAAGRRDGRTFWNNAQKSHGETILRSPISRD